ncbi:MAG: hypothetical protein EAZ74_00495 [Alphaproteobacteria bacterium]|nr:MAG: hypothetical protein EAY76_03135 [Alphaproteobacteria bacterium]TAF15912.1 MAG: hypothetical protein EAZ74_00495 [Alphaproteobacteria bacterium]TAF76726.1 MAG: hypothetical protein EAZ52_02950 [Alphaproteobacteria bacterium]
MSKLRLLYKRVIRASVIAGVIVALLATALYFVDEYRTEQNSEFMSLEQRTLQESARLADLEEKYHVYESSFSSYQEIHGKLKNEAYDLSTSKAQAILERLRKKHRISNLIVEMSPKRSYSQSAQKFVGFHPIYRRIKIRCGAMTDVHVNLFAAQIMKLFPGRVHPVRIQMNRVRPFSQEVLSTVSKGASPVVVEAEITFLWLGIDPLISTTPAQGGGS